MRVSLFLYSIGNMTIPNIFAPRDQGRPNIAEAQEGLHDSNVLQQSTTTQRSLFEFNPTTDSTNPVTGDLSVSAGLPQQGPPDMLSTLVLRNDDRRNTVEDWVIVRQCAAALGIQMSDCVQPFPRAQFKYLNDIFKRVQLLSVPLLRKLYDNPVTPGSGREYLLKMSARRFEIECSTIDWACCDICGICCATAGVFMNDGNGHFRTPWMQCTHHIYSNGTDQLQWGNPRENPNTVVVFKQSCGACRKDVSQNLTNPKFSVQAGFSHGVPIPPELRCLTYAEEALISRIQPVMACKVLKYGQRAIKGMAVFVDRMGSIVEVATVLPRLAKDVHVLILERQRGSKAAHKMVDLVCRRAKVESVSLYCCF